MSVFLGDLGEVVGGWGNIAGFLRDGGSAATSLAAQLAATWERERRRILIASAGACVVLLFGAIFFSYAVIGIQVHKNIQCCIHTMNLYNSLILFTETEI